MTMINPPELNADELADIHKDALARFKSADSHASKMTTRWVNDMKFGTTLDAQWKDTTRRSRKSKKKPTQSIPMTNRLCERIIGDIKNMDLEPKILAADDTDEAHEMSTLVGGIMANIATRTQARAAIGIATEGQVIGGYGYMLLESDYKSQNSDEIELCISQITHADSVLLDPDYEDLTGADADYGFVVHKVPTSDHKNKYYSSVDAKISWPDISGSMENGWNPDSDGIRVCDYYMKYTVTGFMTPGGTIMTREDAMNAIDDPEAPEQVKLQTQQLIQGKERDYTFIMCCKMDGRSILEHTWLIGARRIPLIRISGRQVFEEYGTDNFGIVPYLRSLQEALNYQASLELQLMASAPVAQWMVAVGAITGFEEIYKQAAQGAEAVLPWNAYDSTSGTRQLPAPQRLTNMPDISACIAVQGKIIEQMQMVTGIFDLNSQGSNAPESARSLLIRDRSNQSIATNFVHNTRLALEQLAQLMIDTIPHYYLSGQNQTVSIRTNEGKSSSAQIPPTIDIDKAHELLLPSSGKGYASLQTETADKVLSLLPSMPPNQASLIMDLLLRNMDLQGGQAMEDRILRSQPTEIVSGDGELPEDTAALKAIIAQQKAGAEQAQKTIQKLQQTISTEVLKLTNDKLIKGMQMSTDLTIAQQKADIEMAKMAAEQAGHLTVHGNPTVANTQVPSVNEIQHPTMAGPATVPNVAEILASTQAPVLADINALQEPQPQIQAPQAPIQGN